MAPRCGMGSTTWCCTRYGGATEPPEVGRAVGQQRFWGQGPSPCLSHRAGGTYPKSLRVFSASLPSSLSLVVEAPCTQCLQSLHCSFGVTSFVWEKVI